MVEIIQSLRWNQSTNEKKNVFVYSTFTRVRLSLCRQQKPQVYLFLNNEHNPQQFWYRKVWKERLLLLLFFCFTLGKKLHASLQLLQYFAKTANATTLWIPTREHEETIKYKLHTVGVNVVVEKLPLWLNSTRCLMAPPPPQKKTTLHKSTQKYIFCIILLLYYILNIIFVLYSLSPFQSNGGHQCKLLC